MSLSLAGFILCLLASKYTRSSAFNADVSIALNSTLQQLGTLHLHLRNLDDADHTAVRYLLRQNHCAVRVTLTHRLDFDAGESDRHHFYIYEHLSELTAKENPFVNQGGYYICLLVQPPRETLLVEFARRLWNNQSVYKVFYVLGSQILFYDPFVRSEQEFGNLSDINRKNILDVFKNLNGYPLSIYLFNASYSTVYGDSVAQRIFDADGADSLVAKLFSAKMNFTIEFAWPDDAHFGGRMANGEFSGALGRLLRHEVELLMSGFFVKDYLTSDIDFSAAVYMDELCCYVQKAKRIPQSILPLFAVRTDVWIGFFLVGFGSTFLWLGVRVLNRYFNIAHITSTITAPLPIGLWEQCKRIFIDTWVVWVRVNIIHFPPFYSERIFVISLSLVSVIIGALFESSLATVYIRPLYYRDVNTLRELDETNLRIYTKHPAIKDDMFYGHHSELYQHLSDKIVSIAEFDEQLIYIIANFGRFAGVARSGTLKLYDIRYVMTKKIHKIPECPKNYHIAYVFRKHSPYLETMNTLLLRILEAGLVDEWIHQMEQKAKLDLYDMEEYLAELGHKWKVLTLRDVQLAFYALFLGCLLAAIVFFSEFAYKVLKR